MNLFKIRTDAVAKFKKRLNKYLAIVDIIEPFYKKDVLIHIHDPGRLSEILFHENLILLKYEKKPTRKTEWDAIAGYVNKRWVLIHSNYHRKISEAILKSNILPFSKDILDIKPEPKIGNSRLDFLLITRDNQQIWIEVKGCTLAKNNIAIFPDAPTSRGLKHLKTLIKLKQEHDAKLIILIFNPDVEFFMPNIDTDPEFSKVFYKCLQIIDIYPLVLEFSRDGIIFFKKTIPIKKME